MSAADDAVKDLWCVTVSRLTPGHLPAFSVDELGNTLRGNIKALLRYFRGDVRWYPDPIIYVTTSREDALAFCARLMDKRDEIETRRDI